ncbi:hypothetical protein M5E87_08915 [Flavonifractor plautii]|nr:hypothetical protein M5E87_08915 [Flavonifractor plautii]
MKKRIVLSGLLAAALTLSLTACGGDKMPEETPVPTPIQTSMLVPTPTPTLAPAAPKWGIRSLPRPLPQATAPRCSPPPSPSR